jgi:acyl dehydratase
MLDKSMIGHEFEATSIDVEKGQLKFFAKATGEANPIYFDEAAARRAGHRGLPAPPTFLFCLEMGSRNETAARLLGVDLGRLLHGEQQFTYYVPVYGGDRITFRAKITDIYEKQGRAGMMDFIVQDTDAFNQTGEKVGTARQVIVVRPL